MTTTATLEREMEAEIENQKMSKTVDLVYSTDDGGWYFHDYVDDSVEVR